MNCKKAQSAILSTSDTNALPSEIIRHLSQCPECQKVARSLQFFQENMPMQPEPPVEIVEEILQQARKNAPLPRSGNRLFYPILRPALAAAALFMLLIGIFLSLPPTPSLQIPLAESDLQSLQEQSVSIMYQGLSEEDLAFEFLMSGSIPDNFL